MREADPTPVPNDEITKADLELIGELARCVHKLDPRISLAEAERLCLAAMQQQRAKDAKLAAARAERASHKGPTGARDLPPIPATVGEAVLSCLMGRRRKQIDS